MKKITFIILGLMLISGGTLAQTNSTGQIEFLPLASGTPFGAQIDVTDTEVTLSFGGPINRWLGIGFGVQSMTNGGDVVIFDGTNLTDRTFIGIGQEPPLDTASGGSSDWTIVSTDTTTQPGFIGVVATRALTTGDANDYVFNLSDSSINLVWAMGSDLAIAQHSDRGATSSGFTLGVEDFEDLLKFNISPNPISSVFKVDLPSAMELAYVDIYDVLGKQIYKAQISNFNSTIDATNWHSGIYVVRVSAGNVSQTKRIIKQ